MTRHERAAELRAKLALSAHPEGGFYREHYRANADASTAIYFLLCGTEHAAWHRISKDELWHHYEGNVVELHLIWPPVAGVARYELLLLGPTSGDDVRPCRVAPAGVWQAARLAPSSDGYALMGNTVAPGFTFSDWSLADRAVRTALAAAAPAARDVIEALASDD